MNHKKLILSVMVSLVILSFFVYAVEVTESGSETGLISELDNGTTFEFINSASTSSAEDSGNITYTITLVSATIVSEPVLNPSLIESGFEAVSSTVPIEVPKNVSAEIIALPEENSTSMDSSFSMLMASILESIFK